MTQNSIDSGPGRERLTGVVLAGGLARRMGGRDKGLIEVGGRPMIAYIVERLRPQVDVLLVNANRNAEAYAGITGCRVIPDRVGDFAGPLAGMASALEAARGGWVLTVPCDSPLIATDLARRLQEAASTRAAEIAVATDGQRMQPVFALLHCSLLADLLRYLDDGGRKIDRWYARRRTVEVDLSDRGDTFLNVNTPEEQRRIEERLRACARGEEC